MPNPLIAERWTDDAYAKAVICGHANRLIMEQVRRIRMLAAPGHSTSYIVARSGAIGANQVRRVIANRTYARIR